MHPNQLIGKHLDTQFLKSKIHKTESICAFTGESIKEGVLLKDLLSSNFTDTEYIKFKSDYTSVDVALCMQESYVATRICAFTGESIQEGIATKELLKTKKLSKQQAKEFAYQSNYIGVKALQQLNIIAETKIFLNSLRNYSYYADNKELTILKREDVLSRLLSNKETPFVMAVTYSNKKHTSYKTRLNYDSNTFIIATDNQNVEIDIHRVKKYLPILKKWYSIIKGKENSSQEPTYFTKNEILTGRLNHNKLSFYSIEQGIKENAILEKYRNSPEFNLIVFALNKIKYENRIDFI